MSFFISAILLILLVLFFVFIGVGLAIIIGVLLLIAGVVAVIGFVFGGSALKGKDVPQKFNECLLEEQPEVCLEDWTTWDKDKLDVIKVLAKQVKDDLGSRGSSQSTEYVSDSINGQTRVRMELVTEYEKKSGVHEHYVLVKKDGDLKIEELKWDIR